MTKQERKMFEVFEAKLDALATSFVLLKEAVEALTVIVRGISFPAAVKASEEKECGPGPAENKELGELEPCLEPVYTKLSADAPTSDDETTEVPPPTAEAESHPEVLRKDEACDDSGE